MRIASIIAGVVLLALGGVALWGNAKKDDDGYFSTAAHRFATGTYALASDNLDLDFDGMHAVMNRGKVSVAPRTDAPVFVGVARTSEVSRYLHGSAHAVVTDVSYDPFDADYRTQSGGRPGAPAAQGFWAASAHGAGAQTLTWDVADGDWSIVVMNDDASRGVNADVSARAEVPVLGPLGWGLTIAGLVALALAAALTVRGPFRTAALSR